MKTSTDMYLAYRRYVSDAKRSNAERIVSFEYWKSIWEMR